MDRGNSSVLIRVALVVFPIIAGCWRTYPDAGDEYEEKTDTGPALSRDTATDSGTEPIADTVLSSDLDSNTIGPLVCAVGDFEVFDADDLDTILNVECIEGDLIMPKLDVEQVYLPMLRSIGGMLSITSGISLSSVTLPRLFSIGKVYIAGSSVLSVDLSAVTVLDDLALFGNDELTVNLSALETLSVFSMSGNSVSMDLGLDSLRSVTRDISITGNTPFSNLELGALTSVGGKLVISGVENLIRMDMSLLETAGGVQITGQDLLDTVLLGRLETTGFLWIAGNEVLTELDLPALRSISGNLEIYFNDKLSNVSMDALEQVGGGIAVWDNPSFTCDADALFSEVDVTGSIMMCGNAPGGGCGPDTCPDGGV